MTNHTFKPGDRVRVTGRTHNGAEGTVSAFYEGQDFLPVSVHLDGGERAAYNPDELEVIAPEGFEPVEDSMGETQIQGPTVKGEGWSITTDWLTAEGRVGIWPETEPMLSPAAAVALGRALADLGERYGAQTPVGGDDAL